MEDMEYQVVGNPFFTGQVAKSRLIMDPQKLVLLATIHDSLEWIADQITRLGRENQVCDYFYFFLFSTFT